MSSMAIGCQRTLTCHDRHGAQTLRRKVVDSKPPAERVRLDVWLDVACLFKTRSEAQRACRGGKVDVNTQRAKPHRTIQHGDKLAITRSNGRKQLIVVRELGSQHIPKALARTLYEDVTPPLTEMERAQEGAPRHGAPRHPAAASRPDARQRRALRRLKGH
ncbi:MAG: RNA-binding S4 domain-containing protein [Acidobacteriota bacterium]|nr:RNA-binding S4 domain-containing protein [Acidobacteriota bacterium]